MCIRAGVHRRAGLQAGPVGGREGERMCPPVAAVVSRARWQVIYPAEGRANSRPPRLSFVLAPTHPNPNQTNLSQPPVRNPYTNN